MSQFFVFAVPGSFWDADRPRAAPPTDDELFRETVLEATALRRRVASGVNQESERSRLTACLTRVEGELLRRLMPSAQSATPPTAEVRVSWDEAGFREAVALGRFPAITLGDDYLHLLAQLELARAETRIPGVPVEDDPLALGSTMFQASQLTKHLEGANAEVARITSLNNEAKAAHAARAAFLGLVRDVSGYGVIEAQSVFDNAKMITPPHRPVVKRPAAISASYAEPDRDALGNRKGRRKMVERLHAEVEAAIELARREKDGCGGKVNASSQTHEVTTDVFGEWVRCPWNTADGPPPTVRIVYADASEAAPFPLCRRHGRTPPAPRVILKAALMSMRHLDLDREVDFAWYRNREVSQSRALAESDAYCFAYSLEQLKELAAFAKTNGPIELRIYHTGFEPASVGFYRAVTAVLSGDEKLGAKWAAGGDPWLSVVPYYFQGGTKYTPSNDRDGNPIVWC